MGMCSANERWRYIVTSSLIDWAHTQNVPGYVLNGRFLKISEYISLRPEYGLTHVGLIKILSFNKVMFSWLLYLIVLISRLF